jgi:hypothetical protein
MNQKPKTNPDNLITQEEISKIENSWLSDYQKTFLTMPTPDKEVYDKTGKDGKKLKYVKTSYVEKVLNLMFDFKWDFRIKDKFLNPDSTQVIVQGCLTVFGEHESSTFDITKEQFGGGDIEGSYADAYKSASADSLKKCATKLGLFADIYGGDETGKDPAKTAEDKLQTIKELIKTLNVLEIKITAGDQRFLDRIIEEKEVVSYDKAITQLKKKLPK